MWMDEKIQSDCKNYDILKDDREKYDGGDNDIDVDDDDGDDNDDDDDDDDVSVATVKKSPP